MKILPATLSLILLLAITGCSSYVETKFEEYQYDPDDMSKVIGKTVFENKVKAGWFAKIKESAHNFDWLWGEGQHLKFGAQSDGLDNTRQVQALAIGTEQGLRNFNRLVETTTNFKLNQDKFNNDHEFRMARLEAAMADKTEEEEVKEE